jgi:hypothetical protein
LIGIVLGLLRRAISDLICLRLHQAGKHTDLHKHELDLQASQRRAQSFTTGSVDSIALRFEKDLNRWLKPVLFH